MFAINAKNTTSFVSSYVLGLDDFAGRLTKVKNSFLIVSGLHRIDMIFVVKCGSC